MTQPDKLSGNDHIISACYDSLLSSYEYREKEIAELKRENERLREALKNFVDISFPCWSDGGCTDEYLVAKDKAYNILHSDKD